MKYFKISSILAAIALVCALVLAAMDMLTSPIIAKNNKETEKNTIVSIFKDYNEEKSVSVDVPEDNAYILAIVLAKDSSGNELGYVYTVSGKNAYGTIKLMVAIKDNEVIQVEFLENGQSFASTVDKHVHANYPSSEKKSIDVGFTSENQTFEGTLDESDVANIDVACGATYGAKLVKELVNAALEVAERR